MLSNKLTFSLASLVMFAVGFALLAMPAVAQKVTVLGGENGYTVGSTDATPANPSDFLVIRRSVSNGILETDDKNSVFTRPVDGETAGNLLEDTALPDLEDFFEKGGTIDVVTPISSRFEQADNRWHEVVISEIQWALDWRPAANNTFQPHDDKQWIELYNNTGGSTDKVDSAWAYHRDKIDGRGTDHGARAITGVRVLFINNLYLGTKSAASPPTDKVGGYIGVTGDGTEVVYTYLNVRPTFGDAIDDGNFLIDAAGVDEAANHYTAVYKVLDRASNMGRGGRVGPMPGQSGSSAKTAEDTPTEVGTLTDGEYTPLISAYRKHILLLDDQTGQGRYHPDHLFAAGADLAQWGASLEEGNLVRRRNISEAYIATPGAEHLTPKLPDATVIPIGVVFNEVRNDASEDDFDWIELYNNSTAAVDIGAYEISIVTGTLPTGTALPDPSTYKDEDLVLLTDKDDDGQDIMLPAGEYLLIVNRDPEDSRLADGKDITINASNRLKLEGSDHLYYFPKLDWQLPDDKSFNLILRTAQDKNGTPDNIADVVGDLYLTDLRDDLDTKVWPLRNWPVLAEDDDAHPGNFSSQGRTSMTWARAKYEADKWWHKEHWVQHGYMGGTGYRKDLDNGLHLESPGTPGYRNANQGTLADYIKADAGGAITISEIMYDAGAAWDLVQWIELYNNSMDEAVDISGWTMDIRNAKDDEEPQRSFVDDEFEFDEGTIIAPNQTLLVVSATGATNVPANRVYDLYDRHGNDLGLKNRRAYLLSKVGFRLELYDDAISQQLVDAAGNAYLSGASVIVGEANPDDANDGGWVLHEVSGEGDARHSMVRQYGARFGTKNETLGYETAAPGTMTGAWREAGLESGNIGIFYGHTDDFSTPAFRRGGPLPVSLASFRPYRDKATGEVVVRWVTVSELNNAGFNILRSDTKAGEFKVINLTGMIAGHGTTSEKHVYTYIDKTTKPNVTYYYQIEDVSLDGKRSTLTTTHLRGNVNAAGKLTTTWSDLKLQK